MTRLTCLLALLLALAVPSYAQDTLYVDVAAAGEDTGLSWADAFTRLRPALVDAEPGSVFLVAEGVYTPARMLRGRSFVVPAGVQIYGGFASGGGARDVTPNDGVMDTILTGELHDDGNPLNNSLHVVRLDGRTTEITSNPSDESYVRIDGLTITGGYADGTNFPDQSGGGLLCRGEDGGMCNPVITNVSFVGNVARYGGAVRAYGATGGESSPVFINVSFFGNSVSERGGAVHIHGEHGESSPTFTNVLFSGNTAGELGGAIRIFSPDSFARPSLGDGESAGESGGGHIVVKGEAPSTAHPVFTHVSISGNEADALGGAVSMDGTGGGDVNPAFVNSILWGNRGAGGSLDQIHIDGATATLGRSVLQGGCEGITASGFPPGCSDVLDADPRFADPDGADDEAGTSDDDLSLQTVSPGIDFGDVSVLPPDTHDMDGGGDTEEPMPVDLAGARRTRGARVDVGAFAATPLASLNGADGWRMLAAPSTSATVGGLLADLHTQGFPGASTELGSSNVYFYDESDTGELADGYNAPASATSALPPGVGIFVSAFADDDPSEAGVQGGGFPKALVVPGAEPPAPFAFAPSYTDSGVPTHDGWNLFGNPFLDGLDWDASGWTKTQMSNAIYVWDPNHPDGAQYRTHNGLGSGGLGSVLARMQGFWAIATGPGAELVAPEAARVPDGGVFHGLTAPASTEPSSKAATSETFAFRVEAEVSGHTLANGAWVSVSDDASFRLDRFDAFELASAAPEAVHLFWRAPEGTGFDIAAIPVPSRTVRLPLDVAVSGTPVRALTLTWPTIPSGWKAVLIDRETGTKVKLHRETSYSFHLAPSASRAVARAESRREDLHLPAGLATPHVVGAPGASGTSAKGAGERSRFVVLLKKRGGSSAAEPDEDDADTLGGAMESETAFASSPTLRPDALALLAPSPNPVRGAVALSYDVPLASEVTVVIYDALGREVAVPARGQHEAGRHSARVDLTSLAPGIYIVRLTSGAETLVKRFTAVR